MMPGAWALVLGAACGGTLASQPAEPLLRHVEPLLHGRLQEPPPLVHPGILVTRSMLEHIRANVKARREPQWSAYLDVMNPNHTIGPTEGGRQAVWLANLSYVSEPEKLWVSV
jgi:hypothetical protein